MKVGQDPPEEPRRERPVVEGSRLDEPESQLAVQLHRLVVGRDRHEPHRVAVSQGRDQIANQRRRHASAPESEREREREREMDDKY